MRQNTICIPARPLLNQHRGANRRRRQAHVYKHPPPSANTLKFADKRGGFVKFHPPPEKKIRGVGKIRKLISTSSVGGRWDLMVLQKKALTGNPHTAVLVGMWSGWGTSSRAVTALNGNPTLRFERDYSSRSLIGIPPPLE